MCYCRKSNKYLIHKILFDMSFICVNKWLKTFRKRLSCITNYFLGDLGPLLLQFRLQGFQKFDVDWPRTYSQGMTRFQKRVIQIGGIWRPFLFRNEVRDILRKPSSSLFGPCDGAESC